MLPPPRKHSTNQSLETTVSVALRHTTDVQHEQSFAAHVVSIIGQLLTEGSLPFSHASTEASARGKITRRDITLYSAEGKPVLTGELKLPYKPDGRSPYNFGVVRHAADKAVEAGVRYFFTWNVNTFVLWDLQQAGKPLIERDQEKDDIAEVASPDDLEQPDLARRVASFWTDFLPRFHRLLSGEEPLKSRSLDERFIDILDAALKSPAVTIRSAIGYRYQTDPDFKKRLNHWMARQGMRNVAAEMSGNIRRTAKIGAYVLASRLMFYKALHRRFQTELRRLRIPAQVKTAAHLRARLDRYFRDAEKITGDYETIFRGDELDEMPFLTDDAVPAWRGLLEDIDGFDFTELDYDLIGPIFERLIAPEERHRWGQHYTKPEVCDIINAFVIKSPTDTILDPACGGGTFLVRAYARKSCLAAANGRPLTHQELLSQINGIDISLYAAHIATVNLASRSLADEANYPRVGVADFFDTAPNRSVIHMPYGPQRRKSARKQDYLDIPLPNTAIGRVDAVIGNPPYIRQEKLDENYKRRLGAVAAASPVPLANAPGRSDIHLYFWPHAASFLKNGGRIALLTSSNWLDTEYGTALQKWMLESFRIVALLESAVEPWFTGARVATTITVLERATDPAVRQGNLVRFAQIRKPLSIMFNDTADEADRLKTTEAFVSEILDAGENLVTPEYRLRLVPQRELAAAQRDKPAGTGRTSAAFIGSKWGVYLRAPDSLFGFLDRFGDRLAPLGDVAEIRRGITSGADEFFFVRDVTDEWLQDRAVAIKENFGIKPQDTDRVRLIAVQDGTIHPIEARYLVPEVHRLAEVTSVEIDPAALPRRMVSISEPLDRLSGTYAAAYIRWGQRKGRQFHKRSTCAARDPWYNVTGFDSPSILWSMSHKYRHLAPFNPARVVPNHNLFGIRAPADIEDELLCAVLNSTLVGWVKCFISRPMGTEGFKTEVVDVRRMPVPDPRKAPPQVKERIRSAFEKMQTRQAQNLVDELELDDRPALDDAVFELLGVTSPHERTRLRDELYAATRALYGSLRHVEVQATQNRSRTARRSRLTPHDVAMEIWDGLDRGWLKRFPEGFLPGAVEDVQSVEVPSRVVYLEVGTSLFTVEAGDSKRKPRDAGEALAAGAVRVNDQTYDMGCMERAQYLEALILAGRKGILEVPKDPRICMAAVCEFRTYREFLRQRVEELAQEHAGVGRFADQVAAALEGICLRSYGGPGWADISAIHEDRADYEFDDDLD